MKLYWILVVAVGIACPAPLRAAGATRLPMKAELFFSMQHPEGPPFPANPHPELPVIPLGDDRYFYDDRELNYAGLQAMARVVWESEAPQIESFDYGSNLFIAFIQVQGNFRMQRVGCDGRQISWQHKSSWKSLGKARSEILFGL